MLWLFLEGIIFLMFIVSVDVIDNSFSRMIAPLVNIVYVSDFIV